MVETKLIGPEIRSGPDTMASRHEIEQVTGDCPTPSSTLIPTHPS